jgi:L-2,4-diaminobutyric acid acetyltransferase
MQSELVKLRRPVAEDGAALHSVIGSCPPLDTNSLYCNLLQCTHFAATSVVAEIDGALLAAVTGYLVPGNENTLFIWQVAVAEAARGRGLARKMLGEILARPECKNVTYIETTVTESNTASWALFEGFARRANVPLCRSEKFEKSIHLNDQHPSEILARIGPLAASNGISQATPLLDQSNIDTTKEMST